MYKKKTPSKAFRSNLRIFMTHSYSLNPHSIDPTQITNSTFLYTSYTFSRLKSPRELPRPLPSSSSHFVSTSSHTSGTKTRKKPKHKRKKSCTHRRQCRNCVDSDTAICSEHHTETRRILSLCQLPQSVTQFGQSSELTKLHQTRTHTRTRAHAHARIFCCCCRFTRSPTQPRAGACNGPGEGRSE